MVDGRDKRKDGVETEGWSGKEGIQGAAAHGGDAVMDAGAGRLLFFIHKDWRNGSRSIKRLLLEIS